LLLFDLTVTQAGFWTGLTVLLMVRLVGRVTARGVGAAKKKLTEPRLRVVQVGVPQSKPLAGALSQVVKKARPAPRPREREPELALELQAPLPGASGTMRWRLPAVTRFQS